MTKKLSLPICVVALSFLLSGCATLFTKSTYPVTINTNPAGADILITNKRGREIFSGQSPAVVKLKSGDGFFSKAEYSVKLSTPGYEDKLITIGADIEGWYFANIIFPWILGLLIIDPATGAMWKLDTEEINTTLKKTTDAADAHTINIIDIKDVPENMKEKLVRIK